MTDYETDEVAFEWFATAHPHEAYESYPERFWELFSTRFPTIPREQMEKVLTETDAVTE